MLTQITYAEDRVDRKSNSGYIFKLNGATISWSCAKQKTVSISTTEAEFVALCEGAKEALWLRKLLTDMDRQPKAATKIHEDNQSCIKLINNEKISNRTKHIDVKYFFIRDLIKQGKIDLIDCSTNDMLAEIMTKPLSNVKLSKLRNNLNLKI